MLPKMCCAKCKHWGGFGEGRGDCSYHVLEVVRPNGDIVDRHVITRQDDVCREVVTLTENNSVKVCSLIANPAIAG